MNLDHPIVKKAWSVVSNREMAIRQAAECDEADAAMEALQPGDVNAEAVLSGAANLLQSVTINYGSCDWTVQQSHLIYQHADRVFGKGQLKFNKPAVTLGSGGEGLRRSRSYGGMRLKYQHQGGL